MSKKEWDEAAATVAKAVVGVMPQLNEMKIRSRVYHFFANETEATTEYDDVNFYFTDDVVAILEEAFVGTEDDSSMVVTSSFRWAFDQLSDAYRYRILERYQHGVIRPHDSPERAQLNRAVRKLADILNTWNMSYNHEGTGSRKAWSNARARFEIDKLDDSDLDSSGYGYY